MSSPAATDFAAVNRERKCNQMVDYFLNRLIDVVTVQDEKSWSDSAECAGVNLPSSESRQLIVSKLRTLLEIQRVLGRQA